MEKFSIRQVAEILRESGVKPHATFTAAAGRRECGYVDAWDLPGGAGYLIEYGINSPDYAIASNRDDLTRWLMDWHISRYNRDAFDKTLAVANVLGHEMLLGASSISSGPFYIVRTKLFCGPKESSDKLFCGPKESSDFVPPEGWCGGIRKFETYAEAAEWVEAQVQQDSKIYTIVSIV